MTDNKEKEQEETEEQENEFKIKHISRYQKAKNINVTNIEKKRQKAENVKSSIQQRYNDVYKYCMPHRGSAYELIY